MQNKELLFESLFKRSFRSIDTKAFLTAITREHPYFTPARFYLLKLSDAGSRDFALQAARTSLLFNNPFWLNFQLNYPDSPVSKPDKTAQQPFVETEKNSEPPSETITPTDEITTPIAAEGIMEEKENPVTSLAVNEQDQIEATGLFPTEGIAENQSTGLSNAVEEHEAPAMIADLHVAAKPESENEEHAAATELLPAEGIAENQPIELSNAEDEHEAPAIIAGLNDASEPANYTEEEVTATELLPTEGTPENQSNKLSTAEEEHHAPDIVADLNDANKPANYTEEEVTATELLPTEGTPENQSIELSTPGEKYQTSAIIVDLNDAVMPEILTEEHTENPLTAIPAISVSTLQETIAEHSDRKDTIKAEEHEVTPVVEHDEPLLLKVNFDPKAAVTEDTIAFQPLYTSDYFASLGIRINENGIPVDRLGKQLKSFTDWLKVMKRLHPDQLPPQEGFVENTIQELAEKSNKKGDVLTEAMAEVLVQQGKISGAVAVYEKLSLLNPSKSAYFAAKIDSIKR